MPRGSWLGIIPDEVYRSVKSSSGDDALCFFTDGLFEARNEIGEEYGLTRLEAHFAATAAKTAEQILESILTAQSEFCNGTPATDDLTLAVCRFR